MQTQNLAGASKRWFLCKKCATPVYNSKILPGGYTTGPPFKTGRRSRVDKWMEGKEGERRRNENPLSKCGYAVDVIICMLATLLVLVLKKMSSKFCDRWSVVPPADTILATGLWRVKQACCMLLARDWMLDILWVSVVLRACIWWHQRHSQILTRGSHFSVFPLSSPSSICLPSISYQF